MIKCSERLPNTEKILCGFFTMSDHIQIADNRLIMTVDYKIHDITLTVLHNDSSWVQ